MDIYAKPPRIDDDVVKNLGPIAPLAGAWEGDRGIDIAPARSGPSETKFRERMEFDPMGPVSNGPQTLYGLRYRTTAWPLGEEGAFHEEVGYWLWDPNDSYIYRCFIVPRAVNVLAGGEAKPDARSFHLEAEVGSHTFGISSNPFLDKAFKTVRYVLDVDFISDTEFHYREDTQLKILDSPDIFHHTDENTLKKV